MSQHPYNPLEKRNLAESIARAVLQSPVHPLSNTLDVPGAGVYIIYYVGDLDWYAAIAEKNRDNRFGQPIYIGKAIPKGGRKGGFSSSNVAGSKALRDRLGQHFASVSEARNLNASDFYYRSLMIDDIWIPLGENMLIEEFKPVWNVVIDGFGNKDPGNRRKDQYKSPWDVLHPGRRFADKLANNPVSQEHILEDLRVYLETGVIKRRKKPKIADIESDSVEVFSDDDDIEDLDQEST